MYWWLFNILVVAPGLILFDKKKENYSMECPKCNGLMVIQSFFSQFFNFEGFKCLNCGKVIEKKENNVRDSAFSIFYQTQKAKDQSS